MTMSPSRPKSLRVCLTRSTPVLGVERAPPPGAKHCSTAREHAAHGFDRQRDRSPIEHAVPSVEEANQLVTVVTFALPHDGADDRV